MQREGAEATLCIGEIGAMPTKDAEKAGIGFELL